MTDVVVVIGAGLIGQAIARRVGAGKHVVLADLRQDNADAAAEVFRNAGFDTSTAIVDVSSRSSVHGLVEHAIAQGQVSALIHAAGVSPSQASPETILKVDLCGTAVVLEDFGNVVTDGGAGVVIASQSGHRLPALTAEEDRALATTPIEELLGLPLLSADRVTDPLNAYQLAKRGNVLAVCSASYYEPGRWTNEEWTAALARAKKRPGFLVPVRIDDAEAPPLLRRLIVPALHNKPLGEARDALFEALRPARRPDQEPSPPDEAAVDGHGRGPQLPGALPPAWGPIPSRNEVFTG